MGNLNFIFIVDVETGVMTEEGVFTTTNKSIKAFSGNKSLYDFIAKVVDSQYEETVSRISRIIKYTFGGDIEKFNLVFTEGNLELTSAGVIQADKEVEME